MTVSIQTINTSTPNSGTGDTIYAAFTKVNSNESNLAVAVNNIQNTYANTSLGLFANIEVTNQVLGSLYFNTGTIYVNGSPVATSASSFTGGNVALQSNFQATTTSISTTTGAVVVAGGAGIGGNLNTGGLLNVSGAGAFGGALSTSSTTDSSNSGSGALVSAGGLGVALNTHLGSGLYVGGTTSLSSTLSVAGATTISSSTASTGTNSGALVVTGGTGIGGSLYVGANASVAQTLTVGNLTVNGTFSSLQQSSTFTQAVVSLQTYANSAPLVSDNGFDVGTVFQTYKNGVGDSHAFLGWDNATGNLKYISTGATASAGVYSGTFGSAKFGSYYAVNNTPSTSTTTGALVIAGGAGIAGNVNIGGTLNVGILNVNGGGINNVAIGAVTPSTGIFTTLVSGNHTPSANLSYNLGSSTAWWNTVYGVSVQAQYADLAENYVGDQTYIPGTVVVFGGDEEITTTTTFADTRVAGAISTNPAYLMNSSTTGLPLALRGRIPCQVYGPVTKGDGLVTSEQAGYAASVGTSKDFAQAVFAKSLVTDLTDGPKVIEVVII